MRQIEDNILIVCRKMETAGLVFGVIFLSCVYESHAKPSAYSATCPDYCNAKGEWTEAGSCSYDEYCCGNETSRSCCRNSTNDISKIYESIDSCGCPLSACSPPNPSATWNTVILLIAPILFFATFVACCCQCWVKIPCKCKKHRSISTTGNSMGSAADPTPEENTQGSQNVGYDLNCNHLEPPSYETVARELPKYEDIFNERTGHVGPLQNDDLTSTEQPAPSGEAFQTAPPPSECHDNYNEPPPEYSLTNDALSQTDSQSSP